MRLLGSVAVLAVCCASTAEAQVTLNMLGRYATGSFDEGAQEIAAYSAADQRLFVTNAEANTVDVVSIADPASPTLEMSIDMSAYGDGVNSVAVHGGVLAVAVEADPSTDPGSIVFFDTAGAHLNTVEVGSLPDMVAFSPDGRYAVVANEGEPADDYSVDPEGSVSIIDLADGVDAASVATVSFNAFDGEPLPEGMHQGNPASSFSQNVEPEYVVVTPDSSAAYVIMQESNAIARIDLATATLDAVAGLGFVDRNEVPIDASNNDGGINIRTWPVFGMYQPDAAAIVETGAGAFLLTANEGDARDYDAYSEEERIADLTLDPDAFPNAAELQAEDQLGRLLATTAMGDDDGDGDHDRIFVYGGRSFSVWDDRGALVWDSGDAFERITAERLPDDFNSTNDENDSFDNRSDDKGPEPEGLTVGTVGDRTYAFIGLERIGGIMVYDVTDPTAPSFVEYTNTRDFSGDAEAGTAGDLAPEGLLFIPAEDSPNGAPLLVVTSEVSGSTVVFEVSQN